jgi:hypothetical protein
MRSVASHASKKKGGLRRSITRAPPGAQSMLLWHGRHLLWYGLLTMPPARPKVSWAAEFGDLRSVMVRGRETRAQHVGAAQ